ncbi:MAG: GatB/YqeY domain-containing protein [Bacilli bacterium]
MPLLDILNEDMKSAMRNGNKDKLNTIRMVKSSVKNEEIKRGKALNDEDIVSIIMKEVKQRNDANKEFKKGNRMDLVDKNQKEIELLQIYLPKQMTDEELELIIEGALLELKEAGTLDIRSFMKKVVPLVKGKVDLSKVNLIIKEKLNKA